MSIERFREAQNSAAGFDVALEELRTGAKRSHWIWYVFPQLQGLGGSPESRYFAIHDAAEAEAYLRDGELRSRYLQIASTVAEQLGRPDAPALRTLMGSAIDAAKLVSSLTLFRHTARSLHARDKLEDYAAIARVADEVLTRVSADCPPCAFTLGRLAG